MWLFRIPLRIIGWLLTNRFYFMMSLFWLCWYIHEGSLKIEDNMTPAQVGRAVEHFIWLLFTSALACFEQSWISIKDIKEKMKCEASRFSCH
jgi:hypothetical protein